MRTLMFRRPGGQKLTGGEETVIQPIHSSLDHSVQLCFVNSDVTLFEPVKHKCFLLISATRALIKLLCGRNSDSHPAFNIGLLLGCGLALDVRNDNDGNDCCDQRKYRLNDGGNVVFHESCSSLVIQGVNTLLCQKILLLMLDVGCVVQSIVHIAVAVRVWNALYCLGGCFAERDCCACTLHHEQKEVFLRFILLFGALITRRNFPFQFPDDKTHDGGRNPHSRDKRDQKLTSVDCHNHFHLYLQNAGEADRAAPPAACQISTSRSFRISSTCGLMRAGTWSSVFLPLTINVAYTIAISATSFPHRIVKRKSRRRFIRPRPHLLQGYAGLPRAVVPAHHQVFSAPFESARHTLSPYPSTSDHKLIDVTERKLRLRDLCGQSFIDALQVAYLLFQLRNGLLFGFGQLRLREIAVEAAENIIIDPVIERKLQMVFVVLKA
uniref:Uncharacterized protein n=1 Tax=Siphoviridae sp. ctHn727 TaxID=2825425 RepID=A0A8S5V7Z7_9CAUD|nr:MAG TPA: hypothetical protein [Siphoviridae sp. ctHn727]